MIRGKENFSIEKVKGVYRDLAIEKKWGFLCYMPFVNIVTCLLATVRLVSSPYCRFHSRQGLVLFGFWVVAILLAFLSQILSLLLHGAVLCLHFFALYFVYLGKDFRIPLASFFADKIPEFYLYEVLTGKEAEFKSNGLDSGASSHISGEGGAGSSGDGVGSGEGGDGAGSGEGGAGSSGDGAGSGEGGAGSSGDGVVSGEGGAGSSGDGVVSGFSQSGDDSVQKKQDNSVDFPHNKINVANSDGSSSDLKNSAK